MSRHDNPPDFSQENDVKHWSKQLKGVDTTYNNGFCFVGPFINLGKKYTWKVGDFVMQFHAFPNENNENVCAVCVLKNGVDGWIEVFHQTGIDVRNWALSVREQILSIVGATTQDPDVVARVKQKSRWRPMPSVPAPQTVEPVSTTLAPEPVVINADLKSVEKKTLLSAIDTNELVEELLKRDISAGELEAIIGV